MISKLITMRQLGKFVSEHRPEKIIEESYVWWMIRDGHDVIISWDFGMLFSCVAYFPITSDDYYELLRMAGLWQGAHGWKQVKVFARFRLHQIEQALGGNQRLAVVG